MVESAAEAVIAGIDYNTHAVDVVLLDEDTDAATWHRYELEGANAFDRARAVRQALLEGGARAHWLDVLAIGIEDPRGYNAGALYRVQGAVLACLPMEVLVHPLPPSVWRKTVGLPGNASKGTVMDYAFSVMAGDQPGSDYVNWPQDACDAYLIALATRTLLVTA